MKTLVTELERLGLTEIRTYIQSGNIVFKDSKRTAAVLTAEIGSAIETRFGESKLALQLEKILGVPITARNWNTVCALLDLTATII